jgi:hypothetical protein
MDIAVQEIWTDHRRAMEEVRTRKRLEHRPRTKAPDGQRRAHQHPRLHRRHKVPRIQADRRELRTAGQRRKGYCRKGALRCRRGAPVAFDGTVREATSKELLGVGWWIQGR